MEFARLDYLQVGATDSQILTLIPSSGRQNLVIGDQTGVLSCMQLAPQSSSTLWSTKLKRISRIQLGMRKQDRTPTDNIYVAHGSAISGFSPAGQSNFELETNIADSIASFQVEDENVFTGAKYIFNHFQQQRDVGFKMIEDQIFDMELGHITGDLNTNPILACHDKCLRIMEGENVSYTVGLPGPGTKVNALSQDNSHTRDYVFGCESGEFGVVNLNRDGHKILWDVKDKTSCITSLCTYDINSDGVKEIIIGREDGTLEIYQNEEQIWSSCINEGITSIAAGYPTNPGLPEVILSTYSGKVMGFADINRVPVGSGNPVEDLNGEISQLQRKLESAKNAFAVGSSFEEPKSTTTFEVKNKMSLNTEDATYSVVIESQIPIESICFQSDLDIELLEQSNGSINQIQGVKGLLATYRFEDVTTTRAEIKIRTVEGTGGDLNAYILPMYEPRVAQTVTFSIKPLCLHQKTAVLDESSAPMNTLTINGNFSIGDVHGWVSQILPGIPPHVTVEQVNSQFLNLFLGTRLICNYARGRAEFSSDSVSTIIIVKDVINNLSTMHKIHIDQSCQIDPTSHEHQLSKIDIKMSELFKLEEKMKFLEGLREISLQDELQSFSSEYKEVVAKADEYKENFEKQPRKLRYLQGVVTDLFIDRCKVVGYHQAMDQIPNLQHILANYNLEDLVGFFNQF